MKYFQFRIPLLILILLVITIEIGYALSFYADDTFKSNKPPVSGSLLDIRYFWEKQIDSKGAAVAWENFKKHYRETEGGAHREAHVFGELLFQKEGVRGVAVCDNSFAFGCYHSFFGKAISVHGVNVISDLDNACVERWGLKGLGCQHGIGHGLLWYLDSPKLEEALALCSKLSWKGPIGGCTSGVFMEYNFHTMADPDNTASRELNPENPYEPCNAVSQQFREACYFEQPQWWNQVVARDYRKVGVLCGEVKNQSSREACFRGFGNILPQDVGYDVPRAVAVCNLMPSSLEINLCLQGASWGFSAEPQYKHLSSLVCENLSLKERELCVNGSDLFGDSKQENL